MSRRRRRKLPREPVEVLVEDLGSRNGTLLNGRRIEDAAIVAPGDVLKLSDSVIQILGAEL